MKQFVLKGKKKSKSRELEPKTCEELCKLWDADNSSQGGHNLKETIASSTGRESPRYNQILTPPLASGRVHSQTLATVQCGKYARQHPISLPISSPQHNISSQYLGHQVVKNTTAHGSPHTSRCAFWSSGCSITVSVSCNSPKIHWRPPSDTQCKDNGPPLRGSRGPFNSLRKEAH